MHLEFFVPGKPATKGSWRVNRKTSRLYADNAREKPWASAVAWMAKQAMAGLPVSTGLVDVEIRVAMARPARSKLGVPRGDVDKLARSILDAMTGVVYVDDSQVFSLGIVKRWCAPGESDGAKISVRGA